MAESNLQRYAAKGTINPETDVAWSNNYTDSKALHSYFDYFFSGQDIKVFIDGSEGNDIPIAALAFDVEQQKVPVYGFWDYAYSTVMRGTRIISGVLNVYTTSTDYMVRMLSEAATARVNKQSKYIIRGLDKDEELIDQYWGRNMNDDSAYSLDGKNLFSSHPPFNLVIVYGIQSSSITGSSAERSQEIVTNYRSDDTPLLTDINERLVQSDPTTPMRIVLENVELTKLHVEYQPDGTPLFESYSFFARDMITPRLDNNYDAKNRVSQAKVG